MRQSSSVKTTTRKVLFPKLIIDAEGDSGKLWKILQNFVQNAKPNYEILEIYDKQDPVDIGNERNNYLIEIGEKLSNNIGVSSN